MGQSKSSSFDEEQHKFAETCKSLTHPARLRIITLIHNGVAGNLIDLDRQIPLSQSGVYQHLTALIKHEIVIKGRAFGDKLTLNYEKLEWLKDSFSAFTNDLTVQASTDA